MRRAVVLGVLGVLSGCATTGGSVATAPPARPDAGAAAAPTEAEQRARTAEAFKREAGPWPQQPLTLAGVALTVESSTPVEVASDEKAGTTSVTLGVGGGQPVTCTLHGTPLDVGGTVGRSLATMKARASQLQVRQLRLEVVERSPAVFVDVLYLVGSPGQQAGGEIKVMLHGAEDASLLCLHDEPGFVETFHRVAGGLAAALARARPAPPAAALRGLDLVTLRGMPVGFERTGWFAQSGGGLRVVVQGSMLVQRSASDVVGQDRVTVAELARDGTVLKERFVSLVNGEPERDLTLTRTRKGVYHYQGTEQGKALEGDLTTSDRKDLLGDPQQVRQVKALLLSGKKPELRFEEYLPAATPVALTPLVLKKLAAPNQGTMDVGPTHMEVTFDATGMPERVSQQAGPLTLVQERVYLEGAP